MSALKSMEIPALLSAPNSGTLNKGFIGPSTPSRRLEPLLHHQSTPSPNSTPIPEPSCRRSLRLASKSNSSEGANDSSDSSRKRLKIVVDDRNVCGQSGFQFQFDDEVMIINDFRIERESDAVEEVVEEMEKNFEGTKIVEWKRGMEKMEGNEENEFLSLRLGTGIATRTSVEKNLKGKGILIESEGTRNDEGDILNSARRFTIQEKGKDKVVEDDAILNTDESELLMLELSLGYPNRDLNLWLNANENVKYSGSVDYGFKNIARRNAYKYAHFDAREEDENCVDSESGAEEPLEQPIENVEDFPGRFSTAMKIIRDREKNLRGQVHKWASGKERDNQWPKKVAPSLLSMCLTVLAKNVDAISSIKYVPDVLRHRLTQTLCDSRRMNEHFLDLLLEDSPSEICLGDCSWLKEDKFEKSFEACNTSNLTVLQFDLCGYCLSDSSVLKTLAPKGLPSLTMISLKGACRISDVGLSALVASAPALRSMNLSLCSLLTDIGINSVADSLGSILRELYLDNCDSLDAMRILPGLKRLQCLEVLSLRGIGSVTDKFVKQLIISNGQNMKELALANCVKLTDSSLKVIAETCSQLCVLDLSHLTKLTDTGMVYLANGCHGIQNLKLCRSTFSDDAVAAFVEASGESLQELSLNNIVKVGQNTAISLSWRCKNLESLDLSWCRNLTDDTLGMIVDSCLSLRVLKIFGCTQVTSTFLDGHSNPNLQIIGLKLTPILNHIKRPDFQHGPLLYSAVP